MMRSIQYTELTSELSIKVKLTWGAAGLPLTLVLIINLGLARRKRVACS
jgi:hypothetical protein